jgi:hypothetical protein
MTTLDIHTEHYSIQWHFNSPQFPITIYFRKMQKNIERAGKSINSVTTLKQRLKTKEHKMDNGMRQKVISLTTQLRDIEPKLFGLGKFIGALLTKCKKLKGVYYISALKDMITNISMCTQIHMESIQLLNTINEYMMYIDDEKIRKFGTELYNQLVVVVHYVEIFSELSGQIKANFPEYEKRTNTLKKIPNLINLDFRENYKMNRDSDDSNDEYDNTIE